MTEIVDIFLEWEEKLAVRRTIVLFVTLWMTYKCFDWAAQFALTTAKGAEAALIIGAVTAPITYLQKVVFDAYLAAKKL